MKFSFKSLTMILYMYFTSKYTISFHIINHGNLFYKNHTGFWKQKAFKILSSLFHFLWMHYYQPQHHIPKCNYIIDGWQSLLFLFPEFYCKWQKYVSNTIEILFILETKHTIRLTHIYILERTFTVFSKLLMTTGNTHFLSLLGHSIDYTSWSFFISWKADTEVASL